MTLYCQHEESAAAVDNRLLAFGEVTLYGKQHSGKGVAILGYGGIILLVKVGDTEKVGEQCLPSNT